MKGIFFAILALLITTLIIPLIIITVLDIDIPILDKQLQYQQETVESDMKIKVYNHKTHEVMELYLEEYLQNVVAAEMPASFEIEALKAQAVAARTYAIWKINRFRTTENPDHPEASICTDHQHCQEWLSLEELKDRHSKEWMKDYWPVIQEAVLTTAGVIMTYNMQPIEPLYHSTSGGRTENSEDVYASALPYLRSVSSPYEEGSPVLVDSKTVTIKDFIAALKKKYPNFSIKEKNLASEIKILDRSVGGNIKLIRVGNIEMKGSELRELLQLRSSEFTYKIGGNNIEFTTRGYGHGVGMSQWGANGMAKRSSSYEDILKHYYQGIILSKIQSYR